MYGIIVTPKEHKNHIYIDTAGIAGKKSSRTGVFSAVRDTGNGNTQMQRQETDVKHSHCGRRGNSTSTVPSFAARIQARFPIAR